MGIFNNKKFNWEKYKNKPKKQTNLSGLFSRDLMRRLDNAATFSTIDYKIKNNLMFT